MGSCPVKGLYKAYKVVCYFPKVGGSDYTPQNTLALIILTPKILHLNFGNSYMGEIYPPETSLDLGFHCAFQATVIGYAHAEDPLGGSLDSVITYPSIHPPAHLILDFP